MRQAGIINPRVLDAEAAGALVVEPNEADVRATVAELVTARHNNWREAMPRDFAGVTYSRLAHDLTAGIEAQLRFDLGCGNHKRDGFVGVDRVRLDGVDVVWDVRQGLPSNDDTVDYIVADNLLEHIGPEFIDVMNDLHRVLKPGGRLTAIVPGVHAPAAAYADPTHVRYFVPETWDYFDGEHARWRDYGQSYGIRPWRVLRREVRDRFIETVMQPVKECSCAS
jgi:SAM-dependent methyltransferase